MWPGCEARPKAFPLPLPTWVDRCSGWSEAVLVFHPTLVVAVTHEDVDPSSLNAFMKRNNAYAVAFNLDTRRWQFATPVHRQAVVCVVSRSRILSALLPKSAIQCGSILSPVAIVC